MARQAVVEVACDRCPRKEYKPAPKEDEKKESDLTLSFMGTEVRFDDLCSRCQETVKNLVDNIKKDIKHRSPKPRAKKKGPARDPSSTAS